MTVSTMPNWLAVNRSLATSLTLQFVERLYRLKRRLTPSSLLRPARKRESDPCSIAKQIKHVSWMSLSQASGATYPFSVTILCFCLAKSNKGFSIFSHSGSMLELALQMLWWVIRGLDSTELAFILMPHSLLTK